MSQDNATKNRGMHGDSSFMLGGVPSSSENSLSVISMKHQVFYYPAKDLDGRRLMWVGIKNLPGEFERRKFIEFRECLSWLLGEEKDE